MSDINYLYQLKEDESLNSVSRRTSHLDGRNLPREFQVVKKPKVERKKNGLHQNIIIHPIF
jgi:hypothetical protein